MNTIIVIYGPTAIGKTTLSIYLAELLNTDIISADSRQVYKELTIGTNKPTPSEYNNTKIHMIDFLDVDKTFSAGEFVKKTDFIIEDLFSNNKIPIISGGTGFYIDAFLNRFSVNVSSNEIVRKYYDSIDMSSDRYKKLLNDILYIDKEYALKERYNIRRLVRYSEVFHLTGHSYSKHTSLKNKLYADTEIILITLKMDRLKLYERINGRVDSMISMGLIDEIEKLISKGYTFDLPALNSVGYKEYQSLFSGVKSIQDCIEKHKKNTRHYAKRQITYQNRLTRMWVR